MVVLGIQHARKSNLKSKQSFVGDMLKLQASIVEKEKEACARTELAADEELPDSIIK